MVPRFFRKIFYWMTEGVWSDTLVDLMETTDEARRWAGLARLADDGCSGPLEEALERCGAVYNGEPILLERSVETPEQQAMWKEIGRILDVVRPDRTKPECTFKGVHTGNECNGTHDHNDGRGPIDYRKERSR